VPEVPDSGSLPGDVRGFLNVIVAQAGDPQVNRIALDMMAETTRSPELAAALRETVAGPRRAAAAAVLHRGIERGELPADIDLELGLDLLISPVLVRLLLTGEPVEDAYLTRLTRVIVAGLNSA
jgi:hypothetical protein